MFPLRALPLALTLCLSVSPVFGQLYTEIRWQNTLGSYQEDVIQEITMTAAGNILLAGHSNSSFGYDKSEAPVVFGFDDYWVVMLDSLGNKLWDEVYGGNDNDQLTAVAPASNGGFLLAGMSRSGAGYDRTEPNLGTGDDYWVVRIDSVGNILWDAVYGGSEWDQLYDVVATDDQGFLLVGWSRSFIGADKSEDPIGGAWDRDYWIVKIDSAGALLWENTIGGNDGDEAVGGVQTADGGYLIVGNSSSGASADKSEPHHGLPGIPRDDYWLVKLNADGDVLWDKTIGGTDNDVPAGILDCGDDTFILYGYSYSAPGYEKSESHRGYGDYWMVKVDAAGSVIWDKTIGSSQSDRATCAVKLSDGSYVFGGTSSSGVNFDKSEDNHGYSDYWLVGTDAEGHLIWDDVIGCDEEDELADMIAFPDGDIIVAGNSESDTCADKNEMNKGGATNAWDFFIAEMRAYEFIHKSETILMCIDSSYTLPWGEVVYTYGTYFDTIAGDYLDTLYVVNLTETVINDSIVIEDYVMFVWDCYPGLYTWINCATGESVYSGEFMCYFYPWEDGEYAVIIQSGDCIDTSDCYYFDVWIDVASQVAPEIQLYPNPGDGIVHIKGLSEKNIVKVLDIYGQQVPVEQSLLSDAQLDLSALLPGIYTILVSNSEMQTVLQYNKIR